MDKFNIYTIGAVGELLIVKQESDKSIIYNVLKCLDRKRVIGVSVHGGNVSGEMSIDDAMAMFK